MEPKEDDSRLAELDNSVHVEEKFQRHVEAGKDDSCVSWYMTTLSSNSLNPEGEI